MLTCLCTIQRAMAHDVLPAFAPFFCAKVCIFTPQKHVAGRVKIPPKFSFAKKHKKGGVLTRQMPLPSGKGGLLTSRAMQQY